MPQCCSPHLIFNLISCVWVCPSIQHDETHWRGLLGFFTHQLEDMSPL